MRKILLTTTLIFAFAGFSPPSQAQDRAAEGMTTIGVVPTQNCNMIETITLGINFNVTAVEIGATKKLMDEKTAEIENAAKDLGLKKFELQSSSFNAYSNGNYGTCGTVATPQPAQYQMNGSLNYNLDNAEKAAELAKIIEPKGYQINLGSNAYRQCQ